MSHDLSRRALLRNAVLAGAAAMVLPKSLAARRMVDPDQARLEAWIKGLRVERAYGFNQQTGQAAIRVGELALGTPYVPGTLDAYLKTGNPAQEPLTLSLSHFDCVTLVESCVAAARVMDEKGNDTWEQFGREIERMRYRDGKRAGYGSRLHYFSEWIRDGERRGLVQDLGPQLGGSEDSRPLRFMTRHRNKYLALADEAVFQQIRSIERALDHQPRRVIPTKRIPQVVDGIESGDILAFATEIKGLDVTHTAFAYRDRSGVLRVLHAPLSGGVVEITGTTLPEYVAAIRRSSGILVARPVG